MLASGTRLGPYTIVDLLGAGGMGEVYRAEDARLGREVAIKVLPPHLADDVQSLERFRREARSVAALSHPNIVSIFDFGSENGVDYAVTELLEGETLRSRLSRGRLTRDEALRIMLDIAGGVAAAHARGIIHRDLKPENIFITTSGRVKVLDFGLARSTAIVSASPTQRTEVLPTEPGIVIGTVGYLAPEQFEGRALTPATDVFALGCVLYEMVCGELPFSGISAAHAMASLLRDEPRALDDPTLDALVRRCLAKNPDVRFRDAGELAEAIRAIDPHTHVTTKLRAPRRWPRFAIAAAVVIALLVAGALVRASRQRQIDSGYDLRVSDLRADGETRRLIELALRADAEGNRSKALELFEEAHRRSANPFPAAFISSFQDALGNVAIADRWSKEASRRLTPDAPAYESLLVRYLMVSSDDSTRELALANSILDVRPKAWRLRLAAAHIHLNRRDNAAALRELKQIDVEQPDDRRLMLVLADRASLGDADGAARDLQRSRLRQRPALLHYTEARIAWSRGDAARARELFDRASAEAAAANIIPVEVDARSLAGLALLRMNEPVAAQQSFAIAIARSKQSNTAMRFFDATALAAYAAHRAGDFEERDRLLEEGHAAVLHPDHAAGIRLLSIRLGSQTWRKWGFPKIPKDDPLLTGTEPLLRARELLANGDAAGARRHLQWARAESIETTGFREEAELLAAELGLPARLLPPDPPYPMILRYCAIFDLASRRSSSVRAAIER